MRRNGMHPKYSFLIPVYNEEEVILELYERLAAVLGKLDGRAEIIFINDGSMDNSLDKIRDLRRRNDRVCYLSLARNFGHQIAITAGMNYARGNAVVVMDADLQDPPELIPEMIDKWKEGYHVVYAKRTKREKEGILKRFIAHLFYRVMRFLADIDIPVDTGDFCLKDRRVVDILNEMPERHRYIRGMRKWVGYKQTAVEFSRSPRANGKPKYTFRKSLMLALDGVVSFSTFPLRLATFSGFFSAFFAIVMLFIILYWRLRYPGSGLTGIATIIMSVFFLGAVQLMSIGLLGEYVGRIYEDVKRRPLYTLEEMEGFHE